jgi:hypothetical protein
MKSAIIPTMTRSITKPRARIGRSARNSCGGSGSYDEAVKLVEPSSIFVQGAMVSIPFPNSWPQQLQSAMRS